MTDTTGHSQTVGAAKDGAKPETVSIGDQSQKPWQFQPGNNANPNGRPKGSRNKASQLLDQLGQENAKDILQKVIDRAVRDGDNYAANLVLNRIWPPRKSNTVKIDLPTIESAADLAKALDAVLTAVAAGEIDPDEASQLGALIETKRKAIETVDIEKRVTALEEKAK